VRFRGTLLLVLVTLALGGFYLLYERPKAEAKRAAEAFEKRFFRAEANDISLIIIGNRDGVVEITHGPGGWMIEKPQRYRPDEGMISKLLETIATGQLTKVVGETVDLPEFGFDRPILTLTLGVGQKRDVLAIGQKNPSDTGYYAYSESLGKIFLVNKELPKDLYLRLYDLREKRLFPTVHSGEIGRVVIAMGREQLDVSESSAVWRVRSPLDVVASGEEVKTFLNRLTGQKAAAFIPWDKRLVKLPQQMHLRLFDRNGRPLVNSKVYYLGTGENEGIVVHRNGDTEAIRTYREFWELLHIDPNDLMERRLFPRDPVSISRISFGAGAEQIVLERHGKQWLKNGNRVDAGTIPLILDNVRNWKAARSAVEKGAVGKPGTVIEVSYADTVERLTIFEKEAGRSMSTALPDEHMENKDIIYFLASSSALGRTVQVSSHELDAFIKQLRQLK
jgi:hypothetical protein